MKILCLEESKEAGVPFYRQHQLLAYLKKKGHTVEHLVNLQNHKKDIKKLKKQLVDADFLWLLSPVGVLIRETIALFIKDNMTEVALRASGVPHSAFVSHNLNYKDLRIVVDFDDEPIIAMPQSNDYLHRGRKDVYLNNPDGSVTSLWEAGKTYDGKQFNPTQNYINIKTRVEVLKMAHVLTSPSEVILKGFGRFNNAQDLLLIPNAIDFTKIGAYTPSTDGNIRILWSLGNTHGLDFLEMENAFVDAMEKIPNLILVTYGQFFKSSRIPMERREHHQFTPGVHKYYDNMHRVTADIGFAYVQNNRFNRCKSPIKVVEYMAAKLPVICGSTLYKKTIDPTMVTIMEQPMDLAACILDVTKGLGDKSKAAYEYAKENFSIEAIGDYVELELYELTKKPLYPLLEQRVSNMVALKNHPEIILPK